jgi:hypothetical protein
MRDIKFRFRLRSKSTGELLTVFIALFNEGSGLLQYPIDLKEWEIVWYDEWSGLKDIDNVDVYENDLVTHETSPYPSRIVYDHGAFRIGEGNCTHTLLNRIASVKVVGMEHVVE